LSCPRVRGGVRQFLPWPNLTVFGPFYPSHSNPYQSDVLFDGFNVSFQATINTHTTDSKGFANLRIALVLAMRQLHLLIFAA